MWHPPQTQSQLQQQPQQSIFVKFGEEQSPHINVQGGGIHFAGQVSPLPSFLDQDRLLDLRPIFSTIVSDACGCARISISSARKEKQANFRPKFSERFKPKKKGLNTDDLEKAEKDDGESSVEDGSDEDDASQLEDLLRTFKKFSSRVLNPLQAKSIARLAQGYRKREKLAPHHIKNFLEFFDLDSPPLQDAALIVLAQAVRRQDNLDLLLTDGLALLDSVLSLASDPPTHEVQISALGVVEQTCLTMSKDQSDVALCHTDNVSHWERQLENIVYPLVHAILKNREATEGQKQACLGVLKNLSRLPLFAAQVKQDVLSRLDVMLDTSRMKAVYLDILCENLQTSKQRISTDVLDNGLLPVLCSMLQEGPCKSQEQALILIDCVCEDDISRNSVLSSTQCVPFIVLCTKYTKCRKVKKACLQVLSTLLKTKKQKEARCLMEAVEEAWKLEGADPYTDLHSVKPEKMTSAVRQKSRAEAKLWRQWDEFQCQLTMLLEKEGDVSKNPQTSRYICDLNVLGHLNSSHMTCLSNAIYCLICMCSWPVNRPRQSSGDIGDVDDFLSLDGVSLSIVSLLPTEILSLSDSVSRQNAEMMFEDGKRLRGPLNHHHTMDVWNRTGSQIMTILHHFLKKLPTPQLGTDPTNGKISRQGSIVDNNRRRKGSKDGSLKTQGIKLTDMWLREEVTLLINLLEYVLIMCVVTCSFGKVDTEGRPVSARGGQESVEKRMQDELAEKEKSADRKLLRRALVEEGVFYIVGQLLTIEEDHIKTLCLTILRLCLQPVNDKAQRSKARRIAQFVPRHGLQGRPQSARPSSAKLSLHQTQFQMRKPGLGRRPKSSIPYSTSQASSTDHVYNDFSNTRMLRPNSRQRPSSAKPSSSNSQGRESRLGSARYSLFSPLTLNTEKKPLLNKYGGQLSGDGSRPSYDARKGIVDSGSGTNRQRPQSAKSIVSFDSRSSGQSWTEETWDSLRSPLEPGPNLGKQCCERASVSSRDVALRGIFSADSDMKKSSILFLHDLVLYADKEIHMELAQRGYISKLVDFLRINDDNELLEITGLTVTRMLVSSDRRICQLFNRHGGASLLMALLQKHPGGKLKQAVCSTLNTVNNVMHSEQATAPEETERRPADIWEHIMDRWDGEDEVVAVLQQFL